MLRTNIGLQGLSSTVSEQNILDDFMDMVMYNGSAILTAVAMKSTSFWSMTPCSLVGFRRRFRFQLAFYWVLEWPNLRPCRWMHTGPLKRRLNSTRLDGVISQNTVLFMVACVQYPYKARNLLTNCIYRFQ
jgi:hypothetical protein